MSRPEVLFPLFAELTALDGVGPKTARLLARLDDRPPGPPDPHPADRRHRPPPARLDPRGAACPRSSPSRSRSACTSPAARRTRPYRVHVRDALTEFQLVFFHAREDWLRRMLPAGQRRIVSGRVELFDGIAQMVHPDHILRPGEDLPAYEPVYPLTEGLTLRDHDPRRPRRARPRPRPARVDRAEPQAPPRMAGLARGARARPRPRPPRRPRPGRARPRAPRLRRAPRPPGDARPRPRPDAPPQGLRHRAATAGCATAVLAALPYAPDRRPDPRRRRDHRRHGLARAG